MTSVCVSILNSFFSFESVILFLSPTLPPCPEREKDQKKNTENPKPLFFSPPSNCKSPPFYFKPLPSLDSACYIPISLLEQAGNIVPCWSKPLSFLTHHCKRASFHSLVVSSNNTLTFYPLPINQKLKNIIFFFFYKPLLECQIKTPFCISPL